MKKKELTPEKQAKVQLRREKEIRKWEKEKSRRKPSNYFWYLVLIISLIYATDEIASQIGTLMKTEIATDLFASDNSIGILDIISVLTVPFQALGLLYRPLADKWGRKRFLIINTIGMSFGLFVVFLSGNIPIYVIGACLVQFFIPHDMHVVYIMESAPSKHRARTYSSIKFFANMSVMLVPLLRRMLMEEASQWRNVYLVPAIVGIVTSLVALLMAREPDTFIDSRLRYLRLTDAERKAEKEKKSAENAQGGLITALKFAMQHKQLRWLYIVSALANIGFYGSINYSAILSYGYAQNFVDNGQFAALDNEVMNAVSIGPVTAALFLFPVGCAVAQVIMGFISDWKGRKTAAIVTAADCLVTFVLFSIGARLGWNSYLVGFLCGAAIGSYYSANDVLIMMISESSPTNLRSSTMSAQFIVTAIGVAVSYTISIPLVTIFGNTLTSLVCLCLLVPGFIAALVALVKKTHDTKGVDLDTVTGCEWD
ncbi:MAG: MFS transporter [Clostridia bacterium]|nr:MFS transporter [Clostridia bacterium]